MLERVRDVALSLLLQTSSRDASIERLETELAAAQQREADLQTTVHALDARIKNMQEELCVQIDELRRRDVTLQQMDGDLIKTRRQYREAVEENGRLEARIQSYVINAQSEQDVLSGEVCKPTGTCIHDL